MADDGSEALIYRILSAEAAEDDYEEEGMGEALSDEEYKDHRPLTKKKVLSTPKKKSLA